jgi:alpha-L-fucosidase 2
MLLQSHAGYVEVLPALPSGWGSGSFRGLRARGAFTVDVSWVSGVPVRVVVTSDAGAPLRLRSGLRVSRVSVGGGPVPSYAIRDGDLVMATRAGATYTIT